MAKPVKSRQVKSGERLTTTYQKLHDVAMSLIRWDEELTDHGDVDHGRNLLADQARAALGMPQRYDQEHYERFP